MDSSFQSFASAQGGYVPVLSRPESLTGKDVAFMQLEETIWSEASQFFVGRSTTDSGYDRETGRVWTEQQMQWASDSAFNERRTRSCVLRRVNDTRRSRSEQRELGVTGGIEQDPGWSGSGKEVDLEAGSAELGFPPFVIISTTYDEEKSDDGTTSASTSTDVSPKISRTQHKTQPKRKGPVHPGRKDRVYQPARSSASSTDSDSKGKEKAETVQSTSKQQGKQAPNPRKPVNKQPSRGHKRTDLKDGAFKDLTSQLEGACDAADALYADKRTAEKELAAIQQENVKLKADLHFYEGEDDDGVKERLKFRFGFREGKPDNHLFIYLFIAVSLLLGLAGVETITNVFEVLISWALSPNHWLASRVGAGAIAWFLAIIWIIAPPIVGWLLFVRVNVYYLTGNWGVGSTYHSYSCRGRVDVLPHGDERNDVMKSGECKHEDPVYAIMTHCCVDSTIWFYSTHQSDLPISLELFAQLKTFRNMPARRNGNVVCNALNLHGSSSTSVNVSRWDLNPEDDVVNNTVLAAYGFFRAREEHTRRLPFHSPLPL